MQCVGLPIYGVLYVCMLTLYFHRDVQYYHIDTMKSDTMHKI